METSQGKTIFDPHSLANFSTLSFNLSFWYVNANSAPLFFKDSEIPQAIDLLLAIPSIFRSL